MMSNVDWIKKNLETLREMSQTVANEQSREGNKSKGLYDDDDISMYGDGLGKSFGIGEVKKRRGVSFPPILASGSNNSTHIHMVHQRAAPPGRCHSCNRIDTPEWRRGPDGARTLCNACGLHYAKLERKRQTEQRSIRPKGVDDR